MTGATQSDCCQVMRRRKEDDIIARSRRACSRAKAGAVLRRARGDVFGSVVVPLGGRLASRSSWRRAAGVLLELFSQPNILTGGCGSVGRGCPAGVPFQDVYEVRVVCEGVWGPLTQKRARCICPLARLGVRAIFHPSSFDWSLHTYFAGSVAGAFGGLRTLARRRRLTRSVAYLRALCSLESCAES